MNITCSISLLNKALQTVQKPLSTGKQINPLLNGIYIQTMDDYIEVQTTDLEFTVIAKLPAQINTHGRILVSGRYFSDIIRKLPNTDINIFTIENDNLIYLQTDNSNYKLLSMLVEDYPLTERINNKPHSLAIPASNLKNLILKTIFACAKDDGKSLFRFSGLLLEVIDNKITFVATDTHRLAIKSEKLTDECADIHVLIPNDFMQEIAKNLPADEQSIVYIYLENNKVALLIDEDLYMQTRTLEGKYPEYNKIIPKDFQIKTSFDVAALVGAVERASLLSKEGKNINFQIEQENITITANNPELGKATEIVKCITAGEGLNITFNCEYILQILKKFDTQTATIYLNSAIAPCSVRQDNDEEYNYIVSPMRVNN